MATTPTFQHAVDPRAPNNTALAGRMTMVFRLEDADTGRVLKEHKLLFMPQSYQRSTVSRTHVGYTQAGAYSDTPAKSGVGLTRFTMQGTTGLRPLRNPDGTILVDGAAALKDLEDTLKAAQGVDIKSPPVSAVLNPNRIFTFTNLDELVSAEDPSVPEWRAVLDASVITVTKNMRRPFVWDYAIAFVAEPHGTQPIERVSLAQAIKPSARTIAAALRNAPLDALNEIASLKEKYVDPLKSIATDIAAAVQNFVDGITSVIDMTFETLNTALQLVRNIEDNVVRLVQEPHRIMSQLRALKRTFVACFQFGDAFGNPDQAHADSATRTQGLDSSPSLPFTTPPTSSQARNAVEVDVVSGDTLSSIARRRGVEPSAIIEAGRLRYPYVDSSRARPDSDPDLGGRRVVYRNEKVLVPSSVALGDDVVGPKSPSADAIEGRASLEDRLFGVDFKLDADGNMVWDAAAGDAALVAGLDNLKQSVEIIDLGLDIGSLAHNPTKGSYLKRDVGTFVAAEDVRVLARSVERTLRTNPRIASVRNVDVRVRGGHGDITFTAVAVNGRDLPSKASV